MTNIYLKVPTKEELPYRQEWMTDRDTMNYNAGYDLDIEKTWNNFKIIEMWSNKEDGHIGFNNYILKKVK